MHFCTKREENSLIHLHLILKSRKKNLMESSNLFTIQNNLGVLMDSELGTRACLGNYSLWDPSF